MLFTHVLMNTTLPLERWDSPAMAGEWNRLIPADEIDRVEVVRQYERSIVHFRDGRRVEYFLAGWGLYREGAPVTFNASDGNTALHPRLVEAAQARGGMRFASGWDVLGFIAAHS